MNPRPPESESRPVNSSPTPLPEGTRLTRVHLRVRQLAPEQAFYRDVLGFEQAPTRNSNEVALGPDKRAPLVFLSEDSGAPVRAPDAVGIHHIAFRYPAPRDLSQALRRLMEHRYPINGGTDHTVAESIYATDPEKNGIELFTDRAGASQTGGGPLDLRKLFALAGSEPLPELAPHELGIGHLHFEVADLARAERFYHEFLGLLVNARVPGAIFFTVGQSHHDIAVNTWSAHRRAPGDSVGLIAYRFYIPNPKALELLAKRAALFGYPVRSSTTPDGNICLKTADPNGHVVELEAPAAVP